MTGMSSTMGRPGNGSAIGVKGSLGADSRRVPTYWPRSLHDTKMECVSPLLCESQLHPANLTAQILFICLFVGLPALGYWLTIVDIRAYLRALQGALIVLQKHVPGIPDWVRRESPGCLKALGLCWPCTETDVKEAYWRLAEKNHPDRGGDRQRFLLLQSHFEDALQWVREREST